jgi:hypothetical protein
MKKILILICFYFFVFGSICQTSLAVPTRGFSLGVNYGNFPIVSGFNSYRYGVEVGYQFMKHIRLVGELAYGYTTNSWEFYGMANMRHFEATYSCIPISASFLFVVPIDKIFFIYGGLGLGYYFITINMDETWYYWPEDGEPISINVKETNKIEGIAPHLNFGIELAVFSRIRIFSEVNLVSNPSGLAEIKYYAKSWEDKSVHFGRQEVKIGVRFYFKD